MRDVAKDAIAQIDALLAEIVPQLRDKSYESGVSKVFEGTSYVGQRLLTRAVAAIERLAPPGSRYVVDAQGEDSYFGALFDLPRLAAILQALRDDYEAGHVRSVEQLIHADVFEDFLEMADELQGHGYKDPAAVIAGSVLEEHLRKLASANGEPIEVSPGRTMKADAINARLGKSVYNKLEQKSVTAWLDLRNKAAHGQYDEYDAGQVAALIAAVREFMVRHPA